MIFSRFRRGASPGTISTLYGMIVAQARMATFYRDYAVADTVNGRFELLVLHLALVLEPLMADADAKTVGQGLFDVFCRDMDGNLREMGVGDLKVPAEMRRIGEAFYGRAQAYRAALADADKTALVEVVRRNVYDGAPEAVAERLAAYIRAAASELARQDGIAGGTVRFPDPALISG